MIFGYGGVIPFEPGLTFTKGVVWMGLDMVEWLEENCGENYKPEG